MTDDRNRYQITRIDAKNCFVESLSDTFSYGKAHLTFCTYDKSRPEGQRMTAYIQIYIDIADWLLRTVPLVPSCTGTEQPYYSNPVAREVAKYFPADVMPEVAALIEDLDLELVSVTQIQSS